MDVYVFDKSMVERYEEMLAVLAWHKQGTSSSHVINEWASYLDIKIESGGWQAIWKIPRIVSEELALPYPTLVFGYVEQVVFPELRARFRVDAVQDDHVRLPQTHMVMLKDLFVTHLQLHQELNIERTAECLDQLRFFYKHLWMPWDGEFDDDSDWPEKHLKVRLQFIHDLLTHRINRGTAAYIKCLLAEAQEIGQRLGYMQMDSDDDDEEENGENNQNGGNGVEGNAEENRTVDEILYERGRQQIEKLSKLRLRLAVLKSELEIFELPELRAVHEKMGGAPVSTLQGLITGSSAENGAGVQVTHVVLLPALRLDQMLNMGRLEFLVPRDELVHISGSLQDVLGKCSSAQRIIIGPGMHKIKFLEGLHHWGSMVGVPPNLVASEDAAPKSILTSLNDDSVLMIINGDFTLEHLTLDCVNSNTGIMVNSGQLTLRNVVVLGDPDSSTAQGIVCAEGAKIVVQNCIFEGFASAIIAQSGSTIAIHDTRFNGCHTGIDMRDLTVALSLDRIRFKGPTIHGIRVHAINLGERTLPSVKLESLGLLPKHLRRDLPWDLGAGDVTYKEVETNVLALNQNGRLLLPISLRYIMEDYYSPLHETAEWADLTFPESSLDSSSSTDPVESMRAQYRADAATMTTEAGDAGGDLNLQTHFVAAGQPGVLYEVMPMLPIELSPTTQSRFITELRVQAEAQPQDEAVAGASGSNPMKRDVTGVSKTEVQAPGTSETAELTPRMEAAMSMPSLERDDSMQTPDTTATMAAPEEVPTSPMHFCLENCAPEEED